MVVLTRRSIAGHELCKEGRHVDNVPTNSAGVPAATLCRFLRLFMLHQVVFLRPDVLSHAFGVGSMFQVLLRRGRVLASHIPCVVLSYNLSVPIPLYIRVYVERRMNFQFLHLDAVLDVNATAR